MIGAAVVVGLLFLWAVGSAWLVVEAGSHASDGLDDVEVVRRGSSPSALLEGSVREALEHAGDEFDKARGGVANPVLTPWRIVPVAGRQLDAARDLTEAAADGVEIAHTAVARLRRLADAPPSAGPERVAALKELAAITDQAYEDLRGIDVGSGSHLVGPLANAHQRLVEARRKAVDGLAKARSGTAAVARLFQGPSRYLLLAANNAEMRAGSGMFLSAAELVARDGRLRLGKVDPTADLLLPRGTVSVSGDLPANWGFLDPANDFRNLGLSADFPTSASLAAAMWPHTSGGAPVDGVIAVDVRGLASLLRVTGAVVVDGVTYDADSVERQLFNEQYRDFGSAAERRDRLGHVAAAVFDRLERTRWPVDTLAQEIWRAVVLRHLIVWSSDPEDESAWRSAGADGQLDRSSLAVSVINRGANKLDQFLATTSAISTSRTGDGRTKVSVSVRLDNQTPDGEPTYVAGPNGAGKVANRYDGVVSVDVPGAATDVGLSGGVYPTLNGRDGPTRVVGALVRIPQGQSTTVRVSFELPATAARLLLSPSARVPPMMWRFNGETVDDHRQALPLPPK